VANHDDEGQAGGRRRKIRIDFRKNRAKPKRDKGGLTRQFREGGSEVEDVHQGESVRAKGDLSRKRTVIVGDRPAGDAQLRQGVVTTLRGLVVEVDDGASLWGCSVRRLLKTRLIDERHPVTVGDRVRFRPVLIADSIGRAVSEEQHLPEGVIEEIDERRTVLARFYEHRVQVIAANVDIAVIVVSADQPTLRPHLIDRYLVAVHQGNMRPIVCINKADLDADGIAAAVVARYAGLGYRAILSCVPDGRGIDDLRVLLRGQTSALVGPSGVGKSTLLNAIEPGFSLKIGTLTDLKRGRHTTTTARLLRWSFGGYVVDTPGMRQFEPPAVEAQELEAYFVEFVDLIRLCKFQNCTHTHESNCAIKAAVDAGHISPERYDSYCKMFEECAARPRY